MPSLREEKKLWRKGYRYVVGLDEAGRGALAGPVVAAAVILKNPKSQILNPKQILNSKFQCSKPFGIWNLEHWDLPAPLHPEGIASGFRISDLGFRISRFRDSKKLSPKAREKFYKILTRCPNIEWGIGRVSEKKIDRINIKNAAELAMEKAVEKLKHKQGFLIIDGNHIANLKLKTYNLKLIPKADEKVFSCTCASILAKVTRDRMMMSYHKKYPQYRFDLHKGYPTKLHLKTLKRYRAAKIHRQSFAPVQGSKLKELILKPQLKTKSS